MKNNELGKTIKENRILKGLSQNDLSKITGVDPKTISLIERGIRKKPSIETISKLAEALELIDIRLLYLAGYKPEDISELARELEDDTYNYTFQITIVGHGKTYAGDLQEAFEYVQEDIDKHLMVKNFSDEHGELSFFKEYKAVVDFDKNK